MRTTGSAAHEPNSRWLLPPVLTGAILAKPICELKVQSQAFKVLLLNL
jgi:hypothetical protein